MAILLRQCSVEYSTIIYSRDKLIKSELQGADTATCVNAEWILFLDPPLESGMGIVRSQLEADKVRSRCYLDWNAGHKSIHLQPIVHV